jgi:hypothetical protein
VAVVRQCSKPWPDQPSESNDAVGLDLVLRRDAQGTGSERDRVVCSRQVMSPQFQ